MNRRCLDDCSWNKYCVFNRGHMMESGMSIDLIIDATVPDLRPGMSSIDIVTGGGKTRAKVFLVQAT